MLNIRERREQLGISQSELARRCDIKRSTLCDIEKGRINPSIETAIKIAKVLDVSSIQFFADDIGE